MLRAEVVEQVHETDLEPGRNEVVPLAEDGAGTRTGAHHPPLHTGAAAARAFTGRLHGHRERVPRLGDNAGRMGAALADARESVLDGQAEDAGWCRVRQRLRRPG